MDVQVKSLLNFSLPAVWTCAAWVSLSPPTINTSSIDVQGVSSQSGTGMNRNANYGTSQVPELGDPVRFQNAPVPECIQDAGMPMPSCDSNPVLVVLNKIVKTFRKKSNLKCGLIRTRQLH